MNLSDLDRDTDVSHTKIEHWLSVLEASHLIFLLPPWRTNYNKRLVKSPKLYFYDQLFQLNNGDEPFFQRAISIRPW
jgi:predicted AAA+ superfamily ATPase